MSWKADVAAALGSITVTARTSGGSINEAYRVDLADGTRVFVKTNATAPPTMFACEAVGLATLRAGPLRVPRTLACGPTFLALEWLELGSTFSDEDFGRGLAQLHRVAPGVIDNNFMATLPQDNTAAEVSTLWTERRLAPLLARLGDRHLLAHLDELRERPDVFGPREPAALLHGDLWSGNVDGCAGQPVIFDPAIYAGHREIDLAMLQLFGSLSSRCVAAYHEVWPLDAEWRRRIPLWQLYPLAVHAALFGGGYVRQLRDAFVTVLR